MEETADSVEELVLLGRLVNYSFTHHKLKEPEGVSKGSEEGQNAPLLFLSGVRLEAFRN